MRRFLAIMLLLAGASRLPAAGILIPVEKKLPPLAMVNHQVTIAIDDQVATTKVEQTFRNHTDRQLEATYIFPVPKEASVREFAMWVNGEKVAGELMEAKNARKIYEDIVRRTLDPGLLEYMDHNLFKVRVFPVPPKGDQKVALSYTSVAPKEGELISYVYPLKTDGKSLETLEDFTVKLALKSQHPVQNVYSPTHAITVTRPNDREANVLFEKNQAVLDRDFQLYYSAGTKDVGVTALAHRPFESKKGYFMLLLSPRAELSKEQYVPRDLVFVLDTSGSMRGQRIVQARDALKYCLRNMNEKDRFAIINFATTVNKYAEDFLPANKDEITQACKWVDDLEATGGTAINDAMAAALEMRPESKSRTFTLVFFTDGRPTIGETDSEKILQSVMKKNSANTRIFTFGVGDDVNASMLDQMADQSRAVSSYVRETEDIETKVTGLYDKISRPVLANLKLSVDPKVKLSEVYPPKLPDLFHGSQLVVLGRYEGDGEATVVLSGSVGESGREFGYTVDFPAVTKEEKPFVEDLWARRKVGYLLDQIRLNGEKQELVDEVVTLAKRYGIATPYTSYLIVPDEPVPVARAAGAMPVPAAPDVRFRLENLGGAPGGGFGGGGFGGGGFGPTGSPAAGGLPAVPPGLRQDAKAGEGKDGGEKGTGKVLTVEEFAQRAQQTAGAGAMTRGNLADDTLREAEKALGKLDELQAQSSAAEALRRVNDRYRAYNYANSSLKQGDRDGVQSGWVGVNLSLDSNNLRNQTQLGRNCVQRVQNRNCLEVGGVWIDEAYDAKMKTVTVKAMSRAYFDILQRHPTVRDVYSLGNHVVWVTPSNVALIIDTTAGQETLSAEEIDALFQAPEKTEKN